MRSGIFIKARSRAAGLFRSLKYRGKARYCPVCERYSSSFVSAGADSRLDAQCVWCNSLERHRLVWLYFQRKTDFFSYRASRRVLHVAPENCLESRFRTKIGPSYLTADLYDDGADIRMDITDIQYPDNSFDVIYCSHVLEHVPDDRKAMRELRRVLKHDGWAVLLVPIDVAQTFEDTAITDPKERLLHFGQADHVRKYGLDYIQRLSESGFDVTRIRPTDILLPEEIELMGVTEAAGDIYFCRKSSADITASCK